MKKQTNLPGKFYLGQDIDSEDIDLLFVEEFCSVHYMRIKNYPHIQYMRITNSNNLCNFCPEFVFHNFTCSLQPNVGREISAGSNIDSFCYPD